MKSLIVLLSLFLFLIIRPIYGEAKILINEFLIDPQPQQVELINIGSESADISGWYLDDSGGITYYTIPQSSVIYPNSCLVFSGDFNLNKTSPDSLRLFNNLSSPISSTSLLIDSFSYKSSSGSGISYLRVSDGGNLWSTSAANLGLFNSTMASCLITPTVIPSITPTPTVAPTLTPGAELSGAETPPPTPIFYEKVYLNEVMVNPESGGKEWIEIYNDNDFDVFLTDWFIDDLENAGSAPKKFTIIVSAKGYGVYYISSSIFNNDGDNVRLLDQTKNLKDSFEYNGSAPGKTLGRTSITDDNFCQQNPSLDTSNNPCIITSVEDEKVVIKDSESMTPPPPLSSASSLSNRAMRYAIEIPHEIMTNNSGEILGVSSKHKPVKLSNHLSIMVIAYSLLTLSSILFKMKFKYAKDKTISTQPIYPP